MHEKIYNNVINHLEVDVAWKLIWWWFIAKEMSAIADNVGFSAEHSAIYCTNQCGFSDRHESDLRRHGRLVHYQDKDYNRSREDKMMPRNPKTSNTKKNQ